jgi:hypothetical protein
MVPMMQELNKENRSWVEDPEYDRAYWCYIPKVKAGVIDEP